MPSRINKLLHVLEIKHIDALFISSSANIYYLSGYYSTDCFMLISRKKSFILTDKRYYEQISKLTDKKYIQARLIDKDIATSLKQLCNEFKLKRIGFESKNVSFFLFEKLRAALLKNIYLCPTINLIENLRIIKDASEIRLLKQAIKTNISIFKLAKQKVCIGENEQNITSFITKRALSEGLSLSFEPIVAAGKNSSQPHHIANKTIIKNNIPLLIDMGITKKQYKSDLTRTWFLGKITPNFNKLYKLVQQAQKLAIANIKPGISACEIDAFARNFFKKHRLQKNFLHSLGHGIGLEIHEAPFVNSRNNQILKQGMVFTVEPGLYFPNKFGIRIEDVVVVTKKGCEVLSGNFNK
ncbi:MAG: Xaa-Pro peptidase family protein [Candidatus Gygaella obscura]|nr:Xaa-Pro peptidase family protein [Candidatus Gygaella obscura]